MPKPRLSSHSRESTPLEPAAPHQGHGNPAGSEASGTAGSRGVASLGEAVDAVSAALEAWKRASDLWGLVAQHDAAPGRAWSAIDWNLRQDVQAASVATRIAQLRHLEAVTTMGRLRSSAGDASAGDAPANNERDGTHAPRNG